MQLILQASAVKKQYGPRTVLDFDLFQVYEGDKIGVVGLNGAGKSTLLGILSGEIQPDEGTVTCKCDTAFIRQFEELDETLSGGENVKRRIQRELERENTIVFADEPTANLDADGINWLRGKLYRAKTVLLISHDRELLDGICTRIVEVKDGHLAFYTGNYSDYQRHVEEEKARHQQKYVEYQQKKGQLEAAVQGKRQKTSHMRKAPSRMGNSEARLRGDKVAAKQKKVERTTQMLQHRLDRLEKVEKLRELPDFRMNFSLTKPPENKIVLRCEGLSFAYGDTEIFRDAVFDLPKGAKAALTGKNGSGKTTLLRLIYRGNPAITQAPKLRWGYLYQSFENLDPEKTVLDNVLETSIQDKGDVRSILAGLLFCGDEVFKKASVLSGGEKIRLSLAKLIASEANALLLDEPTNYLDIRSIEAVEKMVREYPGTALIVSHDARFLEAVKTMELRVERGKVQPVQPEKAEPEKPADKLLLEVRRTQLVSAISSAPPEEKTLLEAEYAKVLDQLKRA